MPTIKSTDETFEKLKKEHKNLLIDFWAPWCGLIDTNPRGPCVQISPVLEQISEEMKDVTIAKHNIEEELNLPVQYSVKGIPTMILFCNGEQKAVKVGASSKEDLVEFLKKNKI
jgi:thioredoxin 1